MGPLGPNRSDASDLGPATAAARIAGKSLPCFLGFGLSWRCSHRNLPQCSCPGAHQTRTGRRVAPSRLEVKAPAIEAVRAPTPHGAHGGSEDDCWSQGSAAPRNALDGRPASGERATSRLGCGGAGAPPGRRAEAGQPVDEPRLRAPPGHEPASTSAYRIGRRRARREEDSCGGGTCR
jgi:hypothetical protein